MRPFHRQCRKISAGFTLAELLIALAILGTVATFAIPKILHAQQDAKYNAMARETMSMVSGAYLAYKGANGGVANGTMTFSDLTPYMNYVAVDTSSTIDWTQTLTSRTCNDATDEPCLRLHNGGVIYYESLTSFGGTNTTNAVYYYFDPDGEYSGSVNGQGKSVAIFLYHNGRLTSLGNIEDNTASSAYTWTNPVPAQEPDWFSWD